MTGSESRASRPSSVTARRRDGRLRPFLSTEATIAVRILVLLGTALLLIWVVRQVEVVLVAAFVGFAQAATLWPLVRRLRRFLPAPLAGFIVTSLYVAVIAALTLFIVNQVVGAWRPLSAAVVSAANSANQWLLDQGIEYGSDGLAGIDGQVASAATTVINGLGNVALGAVSTAGMATTVALVATFATLFTLVSGDQLWRGVLESLHPDRREPVDAALRAAVQTARWWAYAATATGLIDALLIGLGLWTLGVPYVLPIMVLTFVLGYIPMIGATVAGIVAVAVAFFSGGPVTALWALVVVVVVQQVEGNLLAPLLLSRAMQFHPVITLLLATASGLAFGFVGLFLAVPVAGIIVAMRRGYLLRSREIAERDRDVLERADESFPSEVDRSGDGHVHAARPSEG